MSIRNRSLNLLKQYIENKKLRHHCKMVAAAMEAYARDMDKEKDEIDRWWVAGLLHDLDWEKYPDKHPNKAVNEILPEHGFSRDIIDAVKAHAPGRTGKEPETEIERFLFACDEISGFMNAVSLVRPNGFSDMRIKSVTKKLKDSSFAESVPRDDIQKGAELIDSDLRDHIAFLIEVFKVHP